jgi:CheY-like chemotaxis protein
MPERRTLRFLVADDSRVDQLVAVGLLKRCGHDVEMVKNGAEVLAAVKRRCFDAVLMDVEMPELDGVAATKSVRQTERQESRLPIIIVSASDGERASLDSGADAYLPKPLTLERLQAAITSVVLKN